MKDRIVIQITAWLSACLLLPGLAAAADWAEPGNGLEQRVLNHDGQEREYWLHLPPGFDAEQQAPLVLALHGGGGQAKKFDRSTEGTFTAATDRAGMVVVFPQGIDRRWNCGRDEIFKDDKKYDDVGFLSALIDAMIKEFGIDSNRVYATGISNGGFMSYRLALELSDKIAAVAPVTAQLPKAMADIRPEHPISILVINGTSDPLVPYQGGHIRLFKNGRSRGEILSTADTIERFRRYNQCDEKPTVESLPDTDPTDKTRVVREAYSGGAEGSEVILLRVEGGGHTWAMGQQYLSPKRVGVVSRDINASNQIIDFFLKHPIQP